MSEVNLHERSRHQDVHAHRDEDKIYLLDYWEILRNRKWAVAAVAGGIFLTVLVLTLLSTPIFRAASTLRIERETVKVIAVGDLTPTESPMDRDFYQTQYELLQNRPMALRVIQDLKLVQHPQFKDAVLDAVSSGGSSGGPAPANRLLDQESALIEPLLKALTIQPVRNSRLVKINFDSPDAVLAARVANAWADAFIASNLEARFDASSYARKYLEERLAQLKARLEDSERELVQFATSEQIVSVGEDKPSLSAQNLSELSTSLAKAQDERIRAEAAWGQASVGSGFGMPQVVADVLIQKLSEQRALVAAEYRDKSRTLMPDYPDVQRLKSQLDEIDRQIAREIGNIRASVKSQYAAATARESLLNQRINGLKSDVLDLQSRSIQYNILRREAGTNRELYDALLQRYKEIGVAGNVGTNNISVVEQAHVPARPHSPRLALNLAVGLLLGMFAGVLTAFLLHHLDRSIHSPKMLEDLTHRPVLGVIPLLEGSMSPALASADLRSPFSEAYRSVRTALQFATNHGLPRTLLVTSPGAGEGKTTSAIELAQNIAQLGHRVLLIDADLRSPSIHRMLSVSNTVGLSNVLASSSDVGTVIQATGHENLSVITSGPLPPSPPELLADDTLARLLAKLGEQYDTIVLDGPPVLGLADAPLLANRVEATLLIAAAESTHTDAVHGAMQRLHAAHAHVLGTLLTRFDLKRKGSGYGYGGYSYYSYGSAKS